MNPDVRRIIESSDVWDMTLPWLRIYWDLDTLARYKRAGYTFVSASLQDWPPTFAGMREHVRRFEEFAAPAREWFMIARSPADIERGRKEGKLVLGLHAHDSRPIGEDIACIAALYEFGVRHMVLAFQVRNLVADGCAESSDGRLSNFGRRVVREMNRVGMIVDCSHTGRRSSLEAMELSELPVIFSHSNASVVAAHVRNISDEQLKACAAGGGVIGVVGIGAYLGDAEASTESLFRQIDYIAGLVGPAHVGIGADYVRLFPVNEHAHVWSAYGEAERDPLEWPDPANAWPDPDEMSAKETTCFPPERLPELVELMLTHGYAHETVKGILGQNFRRVYAAAEQDR